MKELMKTTVRCIVCNDTFDLMIDPKDLNRWAEGELIQDALDYLTADERELLLSGHCGHVGMLCFQISTTCFQTTI